MVLNIKVGAIIAVMAGLVLIGCDQNYSRDKFNLVSKPNSGNFLQEKQTLECESKLWSDLSQVCLAWKSEVGAPTLVYITQTISETWPGDILTLVDWLTDNPGWQVQVTLIEPIDVKIKNQIASELPSEVRIQTAPPELLDLIGGINIPQTILLDDNRVEQIWYGSISSDELEQLEEF